MITAETIRQALRCGDPGCKCGKSGTDVHCPVHESAKANFSVSDEDGKILVKCHVGCSQEQVISALKARNLWPSRTGDRPPKFNVVKAYDYVDAAGKLVFQVCRLDPKDFRQRRPGGNGGWIWNMAGVNLVPYRLPDVLETDTVFVVEGEKDADNLADLGLAATTNAGGAGKWRTDYNRHFKGKAVVIPPDNDVPGKAHAQSVAQQLHGVAASIKVVELPGLPEKGDVSDWLEAGGTAEQLLVLVDAAPAWEPSPEKDGPTQAEQAKPTQAATASFLPVPPAFPLNVFPPIYQQTLREVQEAFAVPMEVPACALLSVAGTCIGRARGVLIKSGWIEHGNLWLAIVGASGIGKSPAVRAIYRPVVENEKKFFAAYQEAYKHYQYELDQRQACSKGERAALPPPPAPPVWKQLFVDDATTEALTDALAANPRGILWNRDELSGLILDLDKYAGKDGGTKSRLMSAYDSGVWKVNRRDASKKAFIPNATLSVFGTIQPKALPTIFSNLDAATGFLPRFIFVNAVRETPPLWTDKTVSEVAAQNLFHLVEGLLQFELNEEGEPLIIGVSREAQAIYHAWFNEKVMAPWRNTEAEIYEAVLAKLRGQALRICLILHCMDAVASHKSEMAPVSAATMSKSIRLADYFEIHQRNAWQTIITEGAAATLTPMQRQVVTAILNLESEIRGGLIPTAKVTEEINRGCDERFALSTDTVGRVAASLGLTTGRHLPGEKVRGITVGPSDIEKFKNIFRTSGLSGLSGSNPDRARVSGCNASGSQVAQVVRTGEEPNHLDHLPTTTLTPANIDGVKSATTKTTCTTSPKIISQETMAAWDAAISPVVQEAVRTLNPDDDLKEIAL